MTLHHHWVPLEDISPSLSTAVMASEDAHFLEHNGFDYKAIEHAAMRNMKHPEKRKLGASTISQQTAKNVFLWPGRSWVRKGFEVYFTMLIELVWSKERIMEVYLNSIEMGDGIYGADAVAEWHFGTTADKLTKAQCALIAATLPNPRRFNSARPSAYMLKRQNRILHEMKFVKPLNNNH
jgi:monofunctional biosynthetic peptidoglycan transglycosylase